MRKVHTCYLRDSLCTRAFFICVGLPVDSIDHANRNAAVAPLEGVHVVEVQRLHSKLYLTGTVYRAQFSFHSIMNTAVVAKQCHAHELRAMSNVEIAIWVGVGQKTHRLNSRRFGQFGNLPRGRVQYLRIHLVGYAHSG